MCVVGIVVRAMLPLEASITTGRTKILPGRSCKSDATHRGLHNHGTNQDTAKSKLKMLSSSPARPAEPNVKILCVKRMEFPPYKWQVSSSERCYPSRFHNHRMIQDTAKPKLKMLSSSPARPSRHMMKYGPPGYGFPITFAAEAPCPQLRCQCFDLHGYTSQLKLMVWSSILGETHPNHME